MEMLSHEADLLFVPASHFGDEGADAGLIVRKKPVGIQRTGNAGYWGVHEENRKTQAADHLAVVVIKQLKTYDPCCFFTVEGMGKL